jgi:hypothetical protein
LFAARPVDDLYRLVLKKLGEIEDKSKVKMIGRSLL